MQPLFGHASLKRILSIQRFQGLNFDSISGLRCILQRVPPRPSTSKFMPTSVDKTAADQKSHQQKLLHAQNFFGSKNEHHLDLLLPPCLHQLLQFSTCLFCEPFSHQGFGNILSGIDNFFLFKT